MMEKGEVGGEYYPSPPKKILPNADFTDEGGGGRGENNDKQRANFRCQKHLLSTVLSNLAGKEKKNKNQGQPSLIYLFIYSRLKINFKRVWDKKNKNK